MRHFPLFFRVEDRLITIAGGGEQAAQKVRLLSKTSAQIRVVAPTLIPELAANARIEHVAAFPDRSHFDGAALAIICTGCAGADGAAAALARAAGAVVNVVDRPDLCDVITPAIVDRDPVVVAIGTEGTAPVLARQIKTRIEGMLEPSLGGFARFLGQLRPRVAHALPLSDRRAFWEWITRGPRALFAADREGEAQSAVETVLQARTVPDKRAGRIALIDPGDGAADLLTLRAVQRLQGADLILHRADIADGILELARRDAERHPVERDRAPARWNVEHAARRALSALADGDQVVWIEDPRLAHRALGEHPLVETIPAIAPRSAVLTSAKDG